MEGYLLIMKADGGRELRSLTAPPPLEELQNLVGGYIEHVQHFDKYNDNPCVVYCNEDGRMLNLMPNDQATRAWYKGRWAGGPMLCGDVVILQGDSEFMASL